jgi:hypothetical protein
MARREFTRSIKAAIVLRATNAAGHVQCEGCGLVLGKRPYHIDHTKPDALEVDKSRKLTADDGKLLGVECCHAPKTKEDRAMIDRAKRREAKHLGIARPAGTIKSAGFPRARKAREIGEKEMQLRALRAQMYGKE